MTMEQHPISTPRAVRKVRVFLAEQILGAQVEQVLPSHRLIPRIPVMQAAEWLNKQNRI